MLLLCCWLTQIFFFSELTHVYFNSSPTCAVVDRRMHFREAALTFGKHVGDSYCYSWQNVPWLPPRLILPSKRPSCRFFPSSWRSSPGVPGTPLRCSISSSQRDCRDVLQQGSRDQQHFFRAGLPGRRLPHVQ